MAHPTAITRTVALPRPPLALAATDVGLEPVLGRPHRMRIARADWLVLLAVIVAAAVYAAFGLRVYRTMHASAFDLAFFDQILWNTAHGRWFQTTYVGYNFLGQHFEPVLLPLAALYRLGAGPQTLIVLQAVGAAFAAVPLYVAGRRLLPSTASALLALAYLLSPPLQRGLDFGFHPDLFEPLAAFAALAALLWRRDRLFLLSILALLLLKEDAFLVAMALGWIGLLHGRRRLGLCTIAASLLWGAVVLSVIMPALRNGASSDLVERYGYLGSAPAGIAAGILRHPDRVAAHLTAATPALAVFGLLAAFAFVPLLAPEVLVASVPAVLVGLLSTHPPQRALDLQYAAPVLTLATIAALFGLARGTALLRHIAGAHGFRPDLRRQAASRVAPAVVVCGAALIAGYVRGPFPPEHAAARWRFADDGAAAALTRVERLLPPDASLSAQTGLAPHLSQRRVQWEFPRLLGADYVILQTGGMRSTQSVQAGFDSTAAALPEPGYMLVAGDGPIRLYRRAGGAR